MAGISTVSAARRSHHPSGAASGASFHGPANLARRRGDLEARWRTTLERVTALSVAYHDAAAACPPHLPVPSADQPGLPPSVIPGSQDVARLARRVVAERQSLAEIEAALDRIAAGQYGRCEQCHRPMSAGLLTAQPEARFCSACSRHGAHPVAGA